MLLLWTVLQCAAAAEKLNWHADLGGGFEAALWLNPTEREGAARSGSLFWMFKERDIRWKKTEKGYEVILASPWNELPEFSEKAFFLHDEDSGSLRLDVSRLSAEERKALGDMEWEAGGETPGSLGSSRVKDSPYSRFHERASFVYDVNGAPAGLVRYAMRVFKDDNHLFPDLVLHAGLEPKALRETHAFALATKASGKREGYCGSILRALARNPSTPIKLLEAMWERAPKIWEGDLPYLLSLHPKAKPGWADGVVALIKDEENGEFLRSSLQRYEPLPEELVDLLIATSEYHRSGGLTGLAFRKDLSAGQITRMMREHPWTLGEYLVDRADLPREAWEAALEPDSWELLTGIVKNPEAPEDIAREAIGKIVSDKKHHHVRMFCEGLKTVAASPLLNADEQRLLASYPAIEVRAELAENPALDRGLLDELADDPYAVVARSARATLGGDHAGRIPLEKLSAAHSTGTAFNEACEKDDAETVLKLARALMVQFRSGPPSAQTAIANGSMRSVRAMIDAGMWSKATLASQAGTPAWPEAMSDFVLSGEPDPEVVAAFASSVAQNGKPDDLKPLSERGIRLEGIREQALVWYAVARRDIGLLKALQKLGAPMDVPFDGRTPAQIAVQTRFTEALEILPLDEEAKAALEDFRKRFPGDTEAPWLGSWTNGLDEFETIVLEFNADGTGRLIGATGLGALTAWKRSAGNDFTIHLLGGNGKVTNGKLKASYSDDGVLLEIGGRQQTFKRPEPEQ